MAVAQLLICLLLQAGPWEYQKDQGYFDAESLQKFPPEAFYNHGVELAKAKRTDEAAGVFTMIARNGPGDPLKERALFKRAETYWSGARYHEAHRAYADFVLVYPDSLRAEEAKKQAMWCALKLAEKGESSSLLGVIPLGRSSKVGTELLRDFLRLYPREKFSAQYHFLLAEMMKRDGEIIEAQGQLNLLVEQYPRSPYAAKALIRLAEIEMDRFDGLDYDIRPLREAQRHYQKFVDLYGELDTDLTARVEEERRRLRGIEAEKEYRVAEYYLSRGYPKSAAIYFRAIRKNYPDTEWGRKATEWLVEEGQIRPGEPAEPAGEEK